MGGLGSGGGSGVGGVGIRFSILISVGVTAGQTAFFI